MISRFIILLILVWGEISLASICQTETCVENLIDITEAKIIQARKDMCLPPEGIKNETAWFENNTFSHDCIKQVKVIENNLSQIQSARTHFENQQAQDEGLVCKEEQPKLNLNLSNIQDIDDANSKASCTYIRKMQIINDCGSDAACVFISSAATIAGPIGELFIPTSLKAKGCNTFQDSCFTQLATAFLKSVVSFFEGSWELLKMAGRGIKNSAKKIWNLISGAEDKSSTAQLAAAKASEDESLFQQLKNDFSGTMSKIWGGLVEAIKSWLANSIFCQEWSGIPQYSECKRPAEGFGCTDCKAMFTGLCAISGVIIAEVVPSFLTGGIVTCAKYGAAGAAKVAKLFKVSSASMQAIKSSKLVNMASKPVTEISKIIKTSKTTQTILKAAKITKIIAGFFIKPVISKTLSSLKTMKTVSSKLGTHIMLSSAGPVITYGMKAAKFSGKVIIYSLDNPMVNKAFNAGEKLTEKLLVKSLGPRVLATFRPILVGQAAQKLKLVDEVYKEMKLKQLAYNVDIKALAVAEKKYLLSLIENRPAIIQEYLTKNPKIKLSDLIEDLYPELNYGILGKQLQPGQILRSEEELFQAISKLPDGPDKNKLMIDFQKQITSIARKDLVKDSFTRSEVVLNSLLDEKEAAEKVVKIINNKNVDKEKVKEAIFVAKQNDANPVLELTPTEIQNKSQQLVQAGLTPEESKIIIQSGLASKANTQDAFDVLKNVLIPEVDEAALFTKSYYQNLLKPMETSQRISAAKALQILEDGGMASEDAAFVYKYFEKRFNFIRQNAPNEPNAEALLAEFISQQKKAGLADDLIEKKMNEVFGACK